MYAVARFRHWTFDTCGVLSKGEGRCRANHETAPQLALRASGPPLLLTWDARPRSSRLVRRAVEPDSRGDRRDVISHRRQVWPLAQRSATMISRGREDFLIRERVFSTSTTADRCSALCGRGALDEREDSMRARASLPFRATLDSVRRATLAHC
jgi:hypothetical protein